MNHAKHPNILAVLAALLVITSPFSSRAQFTFTTNNGAITITGYTGSGGNVVIPSTTNGYPVTTIGIGSFSGNTTVTSVMIPNSVISIGDYAFSDCSGLTNIAVDAANSSYATAAGVLFNKILTLLIKCPGGLAGSYAVPNSVISIGDSAFADCYGLTSVTIGKGVTSIGPNAFYDCSSLTSVTVPNSVTSIGDSAFAFCSGLTSATIGTNVTNIAAFAFVGCNGLTSVMIPNSITNMGEYAFSDCPGLHQAYFQGNAPTVNGGAAGSTDSTIFSGESGMAYYLPGSSGWGSTFGGWPTAALQSKISIDSASVFEGQRGTVAANFVVTLSPTSQAAVTVNFSTADGTATVADNDYIATNGVLTFAPGESNKTITVFVNGDTKLEPDETFFANLSNPINAIISNVQAIGTILNDDIQASVPTWRTVTIPGLPAGSRLGSVWARTRNEAYVWASLTNAPQSFLFKWDGTDWMQMLTLSNHAPGKIFGTGPSDVFISTDYYTNASGGSTFARVYRSTDSGTNWTLQVLPSVLTNKFLNFGYFGGTPNNVHFHSGTANAYVTRFDGTNWSLIFTNFDMYGLTLVGTNEGYYVTCSGWGNWNGTTWQAHSGTIGCDVYGGVWGMRDTAGKLSLYATGQQSGNNGPHIWRFNETNSSWSQIFSENPAPGGKGNGIAIWGSASDDVYVVGDLISGQTDSGRIYHFDGLSWSSITNVGTIPRPGGVGGTSADDVWVSLGTAGTLLHLAPTGPPVLGISVASTNALISWPASAVGYRLESASSLTPPIAWAPVTNVPSLVSNFYWVNQPLTNGSRFFRLVNP